MKQHAEIAIIGGGALAKIESDCPAIRLCRCRITKYFPAIGGYVMNRSTRSQANINNPGLAQTINALRNSWITSRSRLIRPVFPKIQKLPETFFVSGHGSALP